MCVQVAHAHEKTSLHLSPVSGHFQRPDSLSPVCLLYYTLFSLLASGQMTRALDFSVTAAQLEGTCVESGGTVYDMSRDPPVTLHSARKGGLLTDWCTCCSYVSALTHTEQAARPTRHVVTSALCNQHGWYLRGLYHADARVYFAASHSIPFLFRNFHSPPSFSFDRRLPMAAAALMSSAAGR